MSETFPSVPLPYIDLDPRNEQELLQSAVERVFTASGGLLNDFSAASPTLALLEGQIFAQGQFLSYINTLPEKLLLDWLNSFCGFERRQGTPASAILEVTITPHKGIFILPKGYSVFSSSTTEFVTTEKLIILDNESTGFVTATSKGVGASNNGLPTGEITGISENLSWLKSISNSTVTSGGSDLETISEVKSRAFRTLRRANPISLDDWRGYLSDQYGAALSLSFQDSAFYVREKEGLIPLSQSNINILQMKVDSKTFISSNRLLILNSPDTNCEIELTVRQRANNISTGDLEASVISAFKNAIPFNLQNYQVKDISHLAAEELKRILSLDTLVDISLEDVRLFCNPYLGEEIIPPLFMDSERTLRKGDLIKDYKDNSYREVLRDFTPGSGNFNTYVSDGSMGMRIVTPWDPEKSYSLGDLVNWSDSLYIFSKNTGGSDLADFKEVLEIFEYERGVHPELKVFRMSPFEESAFLVTLDQVNISPSGSVRDSILSGLISPKPVAVLALLNQTKYSLGQFISIRKRDRLLGYRIDKYAVKRDFTYNKSRDSLNSLEIENLISVVNTYEFSSENQTSALNTKFRLGDKIEHRGEILVAAQDTNTLENFLLYSDSVEGVYPKFLSISSGDYIEYLEELYLCVEGFNPIYEIDVYVKNNFLEKIEGDIYTTEIEKYTSWSDVKYRDFDIFLDDGYIKIPDTHYSGEFSKVLFKYSYEETPFIDHKTFTPNLRDVNLL